MKRIIPIVILIVICLAFSSCEMPFGSIDNLMRAPKLSGESSLLQEAFEKSIDTNDNVILKNSISGDYRSSFLFYDLNNDGVSEAFVFYSEPSTSELANVSIFKLVNNEWSFVSTIKGRGEEIYEVDFADINGDGNDEIFVSWTFLVDSETTLNNAFSNLSDRVPTIIVLKYTSHK